MTEKPSIRQRLLTRIGKIDEALDELGHLPADRFLVIDVDMTQEEHTEWQRRAVARGMEDEEGIELDGVDGETLLKILDDVEVLDALKHAKKQNDPIRPAGEFFAENDPAVPKDKPDGTA